MRTIELTDEFVEQIVINELKLALTMSVDTYRDEGGAPNSIDEELIKSLKVVLRYFAPRDQYEPFLRDLALTEMVRYSEHLGLYDDPQKASTKLGGT